ncbi:large ribosomal subunit protein bL21m isoform X1 [Pantherophis guttatus]|uniref:Large ribosomal subunit protein bL21m isoform X1 n=1 Tax=Pantherophis guttatus TaxID=94885 RepID=A0A6P9BRR8_PANGU|nr:large ribosomal subunit protein bL21m isoform X1 [Pantherophis guttatus]
MKSASVKLDGNKSRKSKTQSPFNSATPSSGPGKMATGATSKIKSFSLPSISPIATVEAASIGCSSKAGPSFLDAVVPLSVSRGMDQEEIQKERYGERTPLQIPNQSRISASAAKALSKIEPIKLDEGVEVIDLTGDTSVVDLTHNDSIVLAEETRQQQNQKLRSRPLFNSCIVCNDNDNEYSESELAASKLPRELEKEKIGSLKSSGTVNCPICMDGYAEIIHSGRLIMSTKCGHIFCSQCLQNSLKSTNSCPACRKKLNRKQYHPIYI